jgi:hypothetical protein
MLWMILLMPIQLMLRSEIMVTFDSARELLESKLKTNQEITIASLV